VLVLIFAVVVIGAAAGIAYFVLGDSTPLLGAVSISDPMAPVDPSDSSKQSVTVSPGATAADIGNDLQQRGLVHSGLLFRLAVDQAGVGSTLAAGEYELSRSMSTPEIIQVLAKGQVKRGLVVTIPEGWRSEQIADRLEATGFTSRDEFLRAVAAPDAVPSVSTLAEAPRALEGYLFPQTYEVPTRVPGVHAVDLMVRMFQQTVSGSMRTNETSLTPVQVITLASIVEREARLPAERATIASVYLNRLTANLPLQADPTVQFAIASRDGPSAAAYNYWKQDLTPQDLQVESLFNTYMYSGLPPGPICNPGEASIKAVLQPAHTDYLYFVANTDGSGAHLFARTLDEHNTNVAKVSRR
jgi:UPF0755 protein